MRCGNAVLPPFTEALVKANLPELCKVSHCDLNMQLMGCNSDYVEKGTMQNCI